MVPWSTIATTTLRRPDLSGTYTLPCAGARAARRAPQLVGVTRGLDTLLLS